MANSNHRGEDFRTYNRLQNRLIRKGLDRLAVEFYIHHPDGAFSLAFNRLAEGVNGNRIERLYATAKRVLQRFVRDLDVRDRRHLHRIALGVLRKLGRQHGTRSWNHDHPRVPPTGGPSPAEELARPPLIASGMDAAAVARTDADPSDGLLRGEMLAAVIREARGIGKVYVRAVHIYRRYAFETGTTHGAYVHLARYAVTVDGRVIDYRPWRTAVDRTYRPDARTVRQVRAIHFTAEALVRAAAQRLGFDPPPA